MQELANFLSGKKTYVIAIAVGVLAGLNAYGFVVPDYVYQILAALGLGTLRAGVTKSGTGS